MATLKDIAAAAGVSIDTVSRALNGKNKGAWPSMAKRAQEIHRIAQKLDYRPNAAARAVRSARSQQIGALVRNNARDRHIHPLAYETLLGVNQGLEAAGYVLSIIRFDDLQFDTAEGSRVFREHMLEGMVVVDGVPDDMVGRLEQLVPQCIWVDNNVWRKHGCLRRDERQVGQTAARAVIDLGYRQLVFVGGTSGFVPHYSHTDRYVGLQETARAQGASVQRVQVPWNSVVSPGSFPLDLFSNEHVLVADGVYWARWITHLAGSIGKSPGYDFGLVCCDESNEIRRYWPGLSRVSFDRFEMGQAAARMMLECLEGSSRGGNSQLVQGEWRPGNTAWGPGRHERP